MKKISLILFCIIQWGIIQGQTVDELFVSMPSGLMPALNNTNRLDLLDLYKAGEKAEVKDMLNGTCILEEYTSDYLRWGTGDNRNELILLPMINDSKLICYIQTVCAPVCDSKLRFFTTSWKELDSSTLITPAGSDFFIDGSDGEDYASADVGTNSGISFMRFDYNPEKKELYQQFTSLDYPDSEKAKNEPKKYKWTGLRFEQLAVNSKQ